MCAICTEVLVGGEVGCLCHRTCPIPASQGMPFVGKENIFKKDIKTPFYGQSLYLRTMILQDNVSVLIKTLHF